MRFEESLNLRQMASNTGWLFAERLVRLSVGFVVGVWIARYLGPGQFGLLNFAMAFVSIVGAISTFGLQEIVVRDLVSAPESLDATLGSAFLIRIFGGFLVFLISTGAILIVRPNEDATRLMVAILGFATVFKASEVVKYWFESQLQAKFNVIVENSVFLIMSLLRIVLIVMKASVMAFVWAILAEAILVSIGLLGIYVIKKGKLSAWKIQLGRMKSLVVDSWPLMLSGLTIMFYMNIDQIMLGRIIGDSAVGIYSATVRISEVWYFIPMAISASAFPMLVKARKLDAELYKRRVQNLLDIMVVISISLALPMTFLSRWLMTALYGEAYSAGGPVLSVHIWASVFVFLGVAGSKWFIIENLQRLSLVRAIWGAIANVILNFLFIPKYGPLGAAWATLISQAVAGIVYNAFDSRARPLFYMQAKAFLARSLLNEVLKKPS